MAEQTRTLPSQIFCLKCKCYRDVEGVVVEQTHFKSKKSHTQMSRDVFKGKCKECGSKVCQFAKNLSKPEQEAEPEPEAVAEVQAPVPVDPKLA
jgi:hypothetical protein